MPITIKDIAKRANVTPMTVSLSLRDKPGVSLKKRKEIRLLAENMGYRPQAAARSMRTQRTNLIGVLLRNAPDKPLHYLSEFEFILGINQSLEPANYVLSIVRIEDVPEDDNRMSRVFTEKMLDGMVVLAGIPEQTGEIVRKLIPHCVFLDTDIWQDTGCIRRDEIHCGRTVAQKMIDLGYRRLIWACGKRRHYSHAERLKGVQQAVSEAEVALEYVSLPEEVYALDEDVIKSMASPDTVVITSQSYEAVKLIGYGSQVGLSVKKDFSIACCEETHELQMAMPWLTCMKYDRLSLGQKAGQLLLRMLEKENLSFQSHKIQSDFFAGSTACGPFRRQE